MPATVERVGAALTDVIVAGQRLLVDRIDLAVVEGRRVCDRAAVSVALLLLGSLLLLGAIVAVDLALLEGLAARASRTSLLLLCALLHGALGTALVLIGVRRPVVK